MTTLPDLNRVGGLEWARRTRGRIRRGFTVAARIAPYDKSQM